MFKLVVIFFLIICNCAKVLDIKKNSINNHVIELNSVQKSIKFNTQIPNEAEKLFTIWFNQNFKTVGFNGVSLLTLDNYSEEISSSPSGKKITITAKLNIITESENLSRKVIKTLEASEEGEIEGDFAINDFELLIENTRYNLINRISEKLD